MQYKWECRQFAAVTSDSRQVKPGTLFVAIVGGTSDGHDFIDEVIAKGAAAIIGERKLDRELPVPYLQVPDSRKALADAAAEFYGRPSHTLKVAGVTGTSGKTTCTYLLEAILHAAGFKVGVIGTVNFRYGTAAETKILPSTHTTPGPVELQSLMVEMKTNGVTHVVMEVSSHALKQRRASGIEFDTMAFTNLTPEHLDFHKDIDDYYASKKLLFTELYDSALAAGKKPIRVVNVDDDFGERLVKDIGGWDLLVFSHRTRPETAPLVSGVNLKDSIEGIRGTIDIGDQKIKIESTLMGEFNVSNILTAVSMAEALGVDKAAIEKGIKQLIGVPGRLERVPNNKSIHVFVDYAHKSDALEKVLKNLQSFREKHRLITVFGCGGDRDRAKRPVMGRIAERLSDLVIVTSDNPRTEEPDAIIAEIRAGMLGNTYKVEPDRRKAIHLGIAQALPGDLVLIAGKGHEDYQIIGTQKYPFDDRKVAAEALV